MLCAMAVCSRRINVFDRETVFKTELRFLWTCPHSTTQTFGKRSMDQTERLENVYKHFHDVSDFWQRFCNVDNVFVTSLCDQDITKTSAQFSWDYVSNVRPDGICIILNFPSHLHYDGQCGVERLGRRWPDNHSSNHATLLVGRTSRPFMINVLQKGRPLQLDRDDLPCQLA
jgi:hypothetical protein